MFLGFANFYRQFIQGFSRIAAQHILMLKALSTESAKSRKGGDWVGGDSKARNGQSEIDRSETDDVEVEV